MRADCRLLDKKRCHLFNPVVRDRIFKISFSKLCVNAEDQHSILQTVSSFVRYQLRHVVNVFESNSFMTNSHNISIHHYFTQVLTTLLYFVFTLISHLFVAFHHHLYISVSRQQPPSPFKKHFILTKFMSSTDNLREHLGDEDLDNEEVSHGPSREDKILGGRGELVTLLLMSIGPLASQISNSTFGLVNTLWLRNAVNELATSALATSTTIDSLSTSFGYFYMICATSQISSLFGAKRGHLAAQVLCDLLRLTLITGALLPVILFPVAKPLMRWFGAQEDVVSLGFSYLLPIVSCSVLTSIYLLLCGCLQAEGRIVWFSLVQISAMLLNACVFNPMFLLGFKVGIIGSGFSIVLSQGLPAIVLLVMFFVGKFTVKPTWKGLLSKPIPETRQALKTGSAALISAVSATLPSIFFQKFIGAGCENEEVFNVMMSMYNSYNRIYQLVVAVYLALTSGYLPSTSYAYSGKRYGRVLKLTLHLFWLVTVIAAVVETVLFSFPDEIAGIFSSKPLFVERFKACMPKYWASNFACSWQYVATVMLQAIQWSVSAFTVSFFTQIVMWPVFSCVLYFTKKDDEVRLFYAVLGNDLASIAFAAPFVILALRSVIRLRRQHDGDITTRPVGELDEISHVQEPEDKQHTRKKEVLEDAKIAEL